MLRKFVLSTLATLVVGSPLTASAAPTAASEGRGRPPAPVTAAAEHAHLGPYATIRRANEVAAYYRSLGYGASAPYHNGDGYYVDIWR